MRGKSGGSEFQKFALEVSAQVQDYVNQRSNEVNAVFAQHRTDSHSFAKQRQLSMTKDNEQQLRQFDREESLRTREMENMLNHLDSFHKEFEKTSAEQLKVYDLEIKELRRLKEVEVQANAALAKQQQDEQQKVLAEKQKAEAELERKRQEDKVKDLQEQAKIAEQKAALFISDSAAKEYRNYMEKLSVLHGVLLPFMNSTLPHVKQEKMDVKLLINRRVQQISATLDQVANVGQELVGLLNRYKHQQDSLAYCFDTLATKMVEQGDTQVYVHQSSAYPIAIAIVYVSQSFPEFFDILMGHMMRRCPFVVPRYIQREPQMDEDSHKLALGFIKKNDAFESEESYNERMAGIISLYAAILQTKNIQGFSNPRGIPFAWTWLARLLNMPPRRITPTILVSFLQISGHSLHSHYGRQFYKMMMFVKQTFISKMPEGTAGSTTRLDTLVSKYLTDRQFPLPEGYITW